MEITIKIPDQVWSEDPTYREYFKVIQQMIDRMAVSHFKYGAVRDNAVLAEVDELRSALQRISMYDSKNLIIEEVWADKSLRPLDTGNTENLMDAANFIIIETIFPKHPKANFKAQSSSESPGLTFKG